MTLRTEILVAGGGPAGATAARLLRRLGHDVMLIERSAVRRRHSLESIAPGAWPVLETLGLREVVEAATFLHQVETLVHWPDPVEKGTSQVIVRPAFDRLLVQEARKEGVVVHSPATVRRVVCPADGRWQVDVERAGERYSIFADFLVDAAGRGGIIKRRPLAGSGDVVGSSPPLAALCGEFSGVRSGRAQMRVEAAEDAWFWGTALANGDTNAIVFFDPRRHRGVLRDRLYLTLLADSRLFAHYLDGDLLRLRIADAGTQLAPHLDERSIKLGDAAYTVDPLSSQGVQTALVSAIKAAAIVHTLRTEGDAAAAREFYRSHYRQLSRTHAVHAARHYARGGSGPFWWARAREPAMTMSAPAIKVTEDTPLSLRADVKRVEAPVLSGMLIRRFPALAAPHFDAPVAFVDGVEIALLFALLQGGETPRQIAQRWSTRIGPAASVKVLGWALRAGLFTPV